MSRSKRLARRRCSRRFATGTPSWRPSPDKEARLASYDRVLDQLKANYTALVDKQIQARIERTGTSDWNVLILQPATAGQPIRVNDYVRMALIPVLSLLVGLALAFVIDGLDHTLKDSSEVKSHLRLPVLGGSDRQDSVGGSSRVRAVLGPERPAVLHHTGSAVPVSHPESPGCPGLSALRNRAAEGLSHPYRRGRSGEDAHHPDPPRPALQ
ncbi:MAG: hypothetical protein R3E12_08325 [Candidatus Eisenbacteria bacterium]